MYNRNLHRKRRSVQPPIRSNEISTCTGNEAQSPTHLREHGQLQQPQTVAEMPVTTIRQLGQAGMAIGQGIISLLRWLLMAFVTIRASLNPESAANMALLAIIVAVFILTHRRG